MTKFKSDIGTDTNTIVERAAAYLKHTKNRQTHVFIPKEMRDLIHYFSYMKRDMLWWKYREDESDFVPVYKSEDAGVVLECIMNPRDLCTRRTLEDLAPLIVADLNVPRSRLHYHTMLYIQNILERTCEW